MAMKFCEPFASNYDKLVEEIDVEHGLWTELQTWKVL